jgi:hypothetical protein
LVSARELASLVGKIISARSVFGNTSWIMTRYCSISIAAAQDWDSVFLLNEYCQRELVLEYEIYINITIQLCYIFGC